MKKSLRVFMMLLVAVFAVAQNAKAASYWIMGGLASGSDNWNPSAVKTDANAFSNEGNGVYKFVFTPSTSGDIYFKVVTSEGKVYRVEGGDLLFQQDDHVSLEGKDKYYDGGGTGTAFKLSGLDTGKQYDVVVDESENCIYYQLHSDTPTPPTPTSESYYVVGSVDRGPVDNAWKNDNSDNYKFTTTDEKIYTFSFQCQNDVDFRFRIGTSANTQDKQLYPTKNIVTDDKGNTTRSDVKTEAVDGIAQGVSDNYWGINMVKNHIYIFFLDVTDASNKSLRYSEVDPTIVISKTKNQFIRTYAGADVNLALPEGVKAYVAHGFEKAETTDKNSQGNILLREINYLPANMPVVLVASNADKSQSSLTAVASLKQDGLAEKETDLWKNSTDGEFHNYLKGVYGEDAKVNEGDYDEDAKEYTTRNFALNWFAATTYGKEHKSELNLDVDADGNPGADDYLGFFRLDGTVRAGYAYLQLPKEVVDFNLGYTGKDNDDPTEAGAKASPMLGMKFDSSEGETTGVEEVKTVVPQSGEEAYYTIDGVKLTHPTKAGLYIYKGKKIVIK